MPPKTIKNITGIRTHGLLEKQIRFENSGVNVPRGSIPALQNAEIDKNNALKEPLQKLPVNRNPQKCN